MSRVEDWQRSQSSDVPLGAATVRGTRRGILYVSAALCAVALVSTWVGVRLYSHAPETVNEPTVTVNDPMATNAPQVTDAETLARQDPMAFVRLALQRCRNEVKSFHCTFTKQERLEGELTPVQEIDFRYREEPRTVYLQWRKNPDGAKRVLYIDDPALVNSDGIRTARVEPHGLARMVVSDIMMPIEGTAADDASRHSIARAGFHEFLKLLIQINEDAAAKGVLDFHYAGTGEVDGRPTIILVRHLPYTDEDGYWPDARLVTHFDRETLLPLAMYSWADQDEQTLLGKYLYSDLELNPDFESGAFKF